jgi:NurA-like 5'-3' nuclease
MFRDLDYCGHDQRAYGYPYPIKACHDRVRLSEEERRALKNIIIETAISIGLPTHTFRDVSMATGHS